MRGSLTREGRWGGASLTGKRSDFCVRKNPTEDASPAPGGTGLRPSRGKPVPPGAGDALGIGSDPSRQGRDGSAGVPRPWRDGCQPVRETPREGRQFRLYERTERRSPIYIRGSFARTRYFMAQEGLRPLRKP